MPAPADYDGDGLTDLAIKDSTGTWYIDWSSNGFGSWDESHTGYGNASAIPVPADYDGDGRADLAIKDATGFWGVDYAADGYGSWNYDPFHLYGWSYGDANSIPVPADYDGDGKVDLAIKNNTTGTYSIDYSSDGPGRFIRLGRTQWNVSVSGYGTATPIPADYNNDGKADIAEKDASGTWMIDFAPTFGAWEQMYTGYGGTSIGVPGDYDHDGAVDLSAVDPGTGDWYVDFANNGFGHWDPWPATGATAMHNNTRDLVDSGRASVFSTTVYDENNIATSTLLVGQPYTVDVILNPGAVRGGWCLTNNVPDGQGCPITDSSPYIGGVCVNHDCVEVDQVEANPALLAPPSLTIHDGSTFAAIKTWSCSAAGASTFGLCGNTPACDPTSKVCKPHRRFAIECNRTGTYWLGYQLRNDFVWKAAISYPTNPDYGVKVVCTASHSTLYGHVTERNLGPPTSTGQPAFYKPGNAIQGAQVTVVETGQTATSDVSGNWQIAVAPGKYTVQITAANHSDTVAVNVDVGSTGFELDTPLEEVFTPLRSSGAIYTTYIDYSRNRLILHVITLGSTTDAAMRLQQAGSQPGDCAGDSGPGPSAILCTDPGSPSGGSQTCPHFTTLSTEAHASGTLAVMNAVWWDLCTGRSLGYMYNGSQLSAFPFCNGGTPRPPDTSTTNCTGGGVSVDGSGAPLVPENQNPMLVAQSDSHQQFSIVDSDQNFLETQAATPTWTQTSPSTAIWDPDRNGISDVSYALQMANPPLVTGTSVYAFGDFNGTQPGGTYDFVFPRTAVGVKNGPTSSTLFLVVTDAEGIQGGHGATANQLALFFRDVLKVDRAFALDSGNSTMMLIQGTKQSTPRRVNTLTGEDTTVQSIPGLEFLDENDGGFGAVANYIKVVSSPLLPH